MKKPIILVFASRDQGKTMCKIEYTDALLRAGAAPLIVPMNTDEDALVQLCETADGFFFAGGVDLDPALYGEEKLNDTVEIDDVRDKLEMTALGTALKTDKPILGVCRGIQSVNVGMGGTLYQDIPSQYEGALTHRQSIPADQPSHKVKVAEGSRLYDITGGEIMTNSFHHQAVKTPAKGLEVTARAEDGMIEALESDSERFILLVQWHPECTAYKNEVSQGIFNAFVNSIKTNRK